MLTNPRRTSPEHTPTLDYGALFQAHRQTDSALTINFGFSGTAAKWTDYWRADVGDMPESVTFAAGSATADLTIAARANSSNANPQTVILTLRTGTGYNPTSPNSATVTINP